MALLSPVSLSANAATVVTPATAASAGGDTVTWTPGRRLMLFVLNADATDKTVTITAQNPTKKIDGDNFTVPAIAHVITPGNHAIIPITEAYADATNTVSITYSAVTSVTVSLMEMNF